MSYYQFKNDVEKTQFINMILSKIKIPTGLDSLLEILSREVIRYQPKNIVLFACHLCEFLLNQRSEAGVATVNLQPDLAPSKAFYVESFPYYVQETGVELPIRHVIEKGRFFPIDLQAYENTAYENQENLNNASNGRRHEEISTEFREPAVNGNNVRVEDSEDTTLEKVETGGEEKSKEKEDDNSKNEENAETKNDTGENVKEIEAKPNEEKKKTLRSIGTQITLVVEDCTDLNKTQVHEKTEYEINNYEEKIKDANLHGKEKDGIIDSIQKDTDDVSPKETSTQENQSTNEADEIEELEKFIKEGDVEELTHAATRLQSNFRGFKTRKEMKAQVDVNAPTEINAIAADEEKLRDEEERDKEIEELEKLIKEGDTEELALAATRLQSNFRGFKARKEMRSSSPQLEKCLEASEISEKDENADDDDSSKTLKSDAELDVAQSSANDDAAEIEELEKLIKEGDTEELSKAATRLQSNFRGFKARKEIKVSSSPAISNTKMNEESIEEEKLTEENIGEEKLSEENVDEKELTEDEKDELTIEEKEEMTDEIEELEKLIKDGDTEELSQAATRLQSNFRGFKARKELKSDKGVNDIVLDEGSAVEEKIIDENITKSEVTTTDLNLNCNALLDDPDPDENCLKELMDIQPTSIDPANYRIQEEGDVPLPSDIRAEEKVNEIAEDLQEQTKIVGGEDEDNIQEELPVIENETKKVVETFVQIKQIPLDNENSELFDSLTTQFNATSVENLLQENEESVVEEKIKNIPNENDGAANTNEQSVNETDLGLEEVIKDEPEPSNVVVVAENGDANAKEEQIENETESKSVLIEEKTNDETDSRSIVVEEIIKDETNLNDICAAQNEEERMVEMKIVDQTDLSNILAGVAIDVIEEEKSEVTVDQFSKNLLPTPSQENMTEEIETEKEFSNTNEVEVQKENFNLESAQEEPSNGVITSENNVNVNENLIAYDTNIEEIDEEIVALLEHLLTTVATQIDAENASQEKDYVIQSAVTNEINIVEEQVEEEKVITESEPKIENSETVMVVTHDKNIVGISKNVFPEDTRKIEIVFADQQIPKTTKNISVPKVDDNSDYLESKVPLKTVSKSNVDTQLSKFENESENKIQSLPNKDELERDLSSISEENSELEAIDLITLRETALEIVTSVIERATKIVENTRLEDSGIENTPTPNEIDNRISEKELENQRESYENETETAITESDIQSNSSVETQISNPLYNSELANISNETQKEREIGEENKVQELSNDVTGVEDETGKSRQESRQSTLSAVDSLEITPIQEFPEFDESDKQIDQNITQDNISPTDNKTNNISDLQTESKTNIILDQSEKNVDQNVTSEINHPSSEIASETTSKIEDLTLDQIVFAPPANLSEEFDVEPLGSPDSLEVGLISQTTNIFTPDSLQEQSQGETPHADLFSPDSIMAETSPFNN